MNSEFHKSYVPRAVRFTFCAPVRYRRDGEHRWADGSNLNMSNTGILFSTFSHPLSPGDRIEFTMQLPDARGIPGGEVRCTGRVTRTVPAGGAAGASAMAVAIDRYELTHGPPLSVEAPRSSTTDQH